MKYIYFIILFLSFQFVFSQGEINARKKAKRKIKTQEIILKPEFIPINKKETFAIKGIILDSLNSEPLSNATIKILNSSKGCLSDIDGKFNLETNEEIIDLQITYIGYNSKILKQIKLKRGYTYSFNITLSEKTQLKK